MTIGIIISGALGRMGQAIARLAAGDPELRIAGGLESPEQVHRGAAAFSAAHGGAPLVADLRALSPARGSVLIEFSAPQATRDHASEAVSLGVNMVIGTTGLNSDELRAISDAAEHVAVVLAPNMSAGVNVVLGLVASVARALPDFDIEITEMHHRAKKDAPSGTARALAEAAASGRNVTLRSVLCKGRDGMVGERPNGQIGIHALRGGDVVGDHTVIFAGNGERIEIIHRAHSRDTFAAGALRAAKFVARREKGLFSMRDVLAMQEP